MPKPKTTDISLLLQKVQDGDEAALNELFPLVYEELHSIAQKQRQKWQGDYTLNTTALVHEAYIKLINQKDAQWNNKSHFYGVASKAMRHILINYAKHRKRKKRGGDQPKLSLEENKIAIENVITLDEDRADTLLAMDRALNKLEKMSSRQAKIVECRFFGGLSIADTAEALGVSPATVKRGWAMAQTWLYQEMKNMEGTE